jgi:hypothetical protein
VEGFQSRSFDCGVGSQFHHSHVSQGPPCHPGRWDFPSPVGDHGCPLAALPPSLRLKCSPTYPPHDAVYSQARCRSSVIHHGPAQRPVVVSVPNRHGREPLCPVGALPRQGSCVHDLGRRYPTVLARTGSCARPRPSHGLRLSLGPRVCAGWCESLLGHGPSRRSAANLSSDAWTYTPAVPLVHTPVTSQRTSAFAVSGPARHTT